MAVKSILIKDPMSGEKCLREGCIPCRDNGKKSCYQRSTLYSNQCVPCKTAGVEKKYIGETARSGKERAGEHYSNYHRQVSDSHMWKHQMLDHDGDEARFEFKVLSSYRTALKRQIAEAVAIRRLGEASLLNSKGVYNRCSLPRLVVEDDRSKEKPIAGKACDDYAEEDWKKLQYKRGITDNQRGMQGGRKKKLKLDEKSQKEDNPRHQGLQKRKMNTNAVTRVTQCFFPKI